MCSRPERKRQWKQHLRWMEQEEKAKQTLGHLTKTRTTGGVREMVTGSKPIFLQEENK